MERQLKITTGQTSRGGRVTRKEVTWSALAERLSQFQKFDVTLEQYAALTTDEKGDLKDKSGFFIGGHFSGDGRKKAQLLGRSLLTLDVDALPADQFPQAFVKAYTGFAFCVHTSASHTTAKPKFRLVFPLTRDVTVEEYEPLARLVASWMSIDAVDKVSYRPSQLMYMPAVCRDGQSRYKLFEGDWLDPDTILSMYADWRDFGAWPCASYEDGTRLVATQMEDPCTKGGWIGAFCQVYDVPRAIEHFKLPYTPTEHENRYTPEGATGSQGAVIYPSATCEAAFIYSHHSHDVAASKCLNSWDLVRLCKWPNLSDKESYDEMLALARSIDEVKDIVDGATTETLPDRTEPAERSVTDLLEPEAEEQVNTQKINYSSLSQGIEDLRNAFANMQDDAYNDEKRQKLKLLLAKLAGARIDPSDEDVLVGQIKDLYPKPKPSKEKLHGDIKKLRRQLTGSLEGDDGELQDIEIEMLKEVLHRYYADGAHIRRFGHMFWIYDHGCWRPTEDEQIKGRVINVIRSLREDRPEDLMTLVAAVGENTTSAIVARLFGLLPSFVASSHTDKDPLGLKADRKAIVNCLNGELHLDKTGVFELRPHNPASMLTSQIPVNYDPDALCPEWDAFCEYVFADCIDPRGMQEHLEELGGYIIQPTRWLRSWVLFHGRTGTGKTTIGKVFGNLLGASAAMRPVGSYDGRDTHAEAGLVGKLMLLDEDFDKGAVLPDGFLKKISEAKDLTANPKNKDQFSFICRALPVILSNSWPATRDVSDALIDRALIWHFTQQFTPEKRDDNKADRMVKEELPGILNRFLSGFERLRKRTRWNPPIECVQAVEQWTLQSNAVGRFISDCIVRTDVKTKLASTDAWGAYLAWMGDNMPDSRKVGRNEFYERCAQVLGPILRSDDKRYFAGWTLREDLLVSFD